MRHGKAALHRGRRRGRSKHATTTCWSEGGPRATLATRNGASTTKRRTTEATERNTNGTTQQTHTDTHTDTPANATKANTHTHTHTHKHAHTNARSKRRSKRHTRATSRNTQMRATVAAPKLGISQPGAPLNVRPGPGEGKERSDKVKQRRANRTTRLNDLR